ncbi:MAG: hypothetical protein L0Y56_04940 [Nitrospira sp.]|nr:hypothetical protein [Nitrospira sp.]
MTEMTLLEGVHDSHGYSIHTIPEAPFGFLSWSSNSKYHLVRRSSPDGNQDGWTLLRKKSVPLTLTPAKSTPINSDDVVAEWKRLPPYNLPKAMLLGVYSTKPGAFEAMFGVHGVRRPRTDLGTDKVVTRNGTFAVDDLVEAHISRPLIKALIDAGVFHLPK